MGKTLILVGIVLIVAGTLWLLGERLGFRGLPGDLVIRRDNVTLYLPIATSIVVSLVLTLVLWLLHR